MSARAPSAVVVGAGPSGLVAAGLLSRAGFDVRVLERLSARREGTRAPTLWPRAMNVLDLLGCGEEVRSAAHRVAELGFVDDAGRSAVPLGDLACWTLPQYRLEEALEAKTRALGAVVHRGTEVCALSRTPTGPSVRLTTGEFFEADVLIAADGSQSVVRSELGVSFVGHEYESRFALIDFDDATGAHPRNTVETYTASGGTLVSVPLPEGVTRLVAPLLERPDSDAVRVLQERLRAYGFGDGFGTVRWQSVFYVSVKIAERFHAGEVALIGDAAHVQPPTGGRGMNNGIEDAMSVAAHLVSASMSPGKDWAGALAEYERERRGPVQAELGLVKHRTDRWVSQGSSEEAREETVPGVSTSRCTALRLAGVPVVADGIVGREVCWADAGRDFGSPMVLAVGDTGAPEGASATVDVRRVPELRVVGLPEPVPEGIYVVRPNGVVVARWSGVVDPAEFESACRRAVEHGDEHAATV